LESRFQMKEEARLPEPSRRMRIRKSLAPGCMTISCAYGEQIDVSERKTVSPASASYPLRPAGKSSVLVGISIATGSCNKRRRVDDSTARRSIRLSYVHALSPVVFESRFARFDFGHVEPFRSCITMRSARYLKQNCEHL